LVILFATMMQFVFATPILPPWARFQHSLAISKSG